MGRRPALAHPPIAVLEVEVRRRGALVRKLQQRHRAVLLKADRLADQIRDLGGEPGSRSNGDGGRRPRNAANLVDSLARTLNGKTMSVSEVAQAVQKAGYRTTSSISGHR
jgi:hypothetical protein